MGFLHNEQFKKFYEKELKLSALDTYTIPAQTIMTPKQGVKAKALRLVKSKKGWKSIDYIAVERNSFTLLFHQIAEGFQREIMQLNEKTKVLKSEQYPHSISIPDEYGMMATNISPSLSVDEMNASAVMMPINYHQIEWTGYRCPLQADIWGRYEVHDFASAYDSKNDTLYIAYLGKSEGWDTSNNY